MLGLPFFAKKMPDDFELAVGGCWRSHKFFRDVLHSYYAWKLLSNPSAFRIYRLVFPELYILLGLLAKLREFHYRLQVNSANLIHILEALLLQVETIVRRASFRGANGCAEDHLDFH